MSDVNTTTPYEFLVRFAPETGVFSGAQMTHWRKLVIDDEVIKNEPKLPVAVLLADLPAEISNVNLAALARVTELENQVADLQGQLDAMMNPEAPEDA